MSSNNIQNLFQKYNNHFDEWKKSQIGIQVNFKGLAIILQKFLLFNVKDLAYDQTKIVDRIFKSYQNKIFEKDDQFVYNDYELFGEDLESELDSFSTDSVLLCSLLVNHPGSINLFLQQQSNKLLQLISEIICMFDDFRYKHLGKMEEVYSECEVLINRNLNNNTVQIQDDNEFNSQQIVFIVESFRGISEEINAITNFCLNLDLYPTDEDKIKKYLDFLENFNFFKN